MRVGLVAALEQEQIIESAIAVNNSERIPNSETVDNQFLELDADVNDIGHLNSMITDAADVTESLESLYVAVRHAKNHGGLSIESLRIFNMTLNHCEKRVGLKQTKLSLESLYGDSSQIALESITDKIKDIVKRLIEGIRLALKFIAQFIGSVGKSIESLIKRNTGIRSKMAGAKWTEKDIDETHSDILDKLIVKSKRVDPQNLERVLNDNIFFLKHILLSLNHSLDFLAITTYKAQFGPDFHFDFYNYNKAWTNGKVRFDSSDEFVKDDFLGNYRLTVLAVPDEKQMRVLSKNIEFHHEFTAAAISQKSVKSLSQNQAESILDALDRNLKDLGAEEFEAKYVKLNDALEGKLSSLRSDMDLHDKYDPKKDSLETALSQLRILLAAVGNQGTQYTRIVKYCLGLNKTIGRYCEVSML